MADDIDFKKAMQGVRRLKKDSAPPAPGRRKDDPVLRAQIRKRAIESAPPPDEFNPAGTGISRTGTSNEDEDDTLFFLRNGVQKKVLRELKKGSRYAIKVTLDLHGLTQAQAKREIDIAVTDCDPSRLTCLLIIHGKGLHSSGGATLKSFIATYLKMLPVVRAYCSAQQRDGGTGAVYVLVRGQKRNR